MDVIGQFDRFLGRLTVRLSRRICIPLYSLNCCMFERTIPVDLMVGTSDSANGKWPYQAPKRERWPRMFPEAFKTRENLNCVTNPYAFEVQGLRFLGVSGTRQPTRLL